jgi:hypothetical protein
LTRIRHGRVNAATATRARDDGIADTPAGPPERLDARLAEQSADGTGTETETGSGLSLQLAKIFGAIIAPTTFLTALLYYFGWSHAYWFFDYFGVNSTVLGLTSTDYIMRSVDALFIPMTVVAAVILVALWAHAALRSYLAAEDRPRAFRYLVPAIALAGAILAVGGFVSVFTTTVLSQHLVAAPLSLGSGILLLAYSIHLQRLLTVTEHGVRARRPERGAGPGWAGLAEWTFVLALVGLSLFWAATDYSAAVGRSRAREFVTELPTYPNVVVYSEQSLSLTGPGIKEVRCHNPNAAYGYRYDGLKLVVESSDQYLFLPALWTPTSGAAILIPRTSSLRLEFFAASSHPGLIASEC